jgi:hypothetical protein
LLILGSVFCAGRETGARGCGIYRTSGTEKSRSGLREGLREKTALCLIDSMIPETKRAEILAALRGNPDANAVARHYRVSDFTVRKMAKQANIKLAACKKKVSPEQRAEIIAALQVNPNASAVAAARGWSPATVTVIAKEAKIPLKMGGRFKVTDESPAASAAARLNSGVCRA